MSLASSFCERERTRRKHWAGRLLCAEPTLTATTLQTATSLAMRAVCGTMATSPHGLPTYHTLRLRRRRLAIGCPAQHPPRLRLPAWAKPLTELVALTQALR